MLDDRQLRSTQHPTASNSADAIYHHQDLVREGLSERRAQHRVDVLLEVIAVSDIFGHAPQMQQAMQQVT